MSHLEEDDPAAALKQFQRALAIDPANRTASANARIARAMLRDYDAAVSGARPEELPDVLNNVGYIAVMNGDFDTADALLRRAIEANPVYHESAKANLDLLAQARNGVPMLALAETAVPASDAAQDIAAARMTADLQVSDDPVPPRGASPSPLVTESPHGREIATPLSTDPSGSWTDALAPALAVAPVGPTTDQVTVPRRDGFRWEPPSAEVEEAIARARAARRAAQSRAAAERKADSARDAGDPRTGAWPTLIPGSDASSGPAAGTPSELSGVAHDRDPRSSAGPTVSPAEDASAGAVTPAPADVEKPAGARSPDASGLREVDGAPKGIGLAESRSEEMRLPRSTVTAAGAEARVVSSQVSDEPTEAAGDY
jgi:Tfp pilus assembly protein PilF